MGERGETITQDDECVRIPDPFHSPFHSGTPKIDGRDRLLVLSIMLATGLLEHQDGTMSQEKLLSGSRCLAYFNPS